MSNLVKLENFKTNEVKPTKLGMLIFAILSKASYSPTPNDVLETFGLSNQFQILKQYTNTDMLTLKDKSSNKVIIAIRGTDDKNRTGNRIRDLISDYGIATGRDDRVYRKAEVEVVVKKVIKRFTKDNVILTGHSLAGWVATKISKDLGVKAVVFNIGSSLMDDRTDKNENVTHYTTNDVFKGVIDPLSISSVLRDDYRTIKVKKKEGLGAHTIDNFLPNKED
jgi:hypothetical protein